MFLLLIPWLEHADNLGDLKCLRAYRSSLPVLLVNLLLNLTFCEPSGFDAIGGADCSPRHFSNLKLFFPVELLFIDVGLFELHYLALVVITLVRKNPVSGILDCLQKSLVVIRLVVQALVDNLLDVLW